MGLKTNKTIVNIVLESLKKGHKAGWYNYGLCGEVKQLCTLDKTLNSLEVDKFNRLIDSNKPQNAGDVFWWPTMSSSNEDTDFKNRQVRIDFLTELLKKLK